MNLWHGGRSLFMLPRRVGGILPAILVVGASMSGCRSDTVRLTFRPAAGTTASYHITVETGTTVRMAGQSPRRDRTHAVLTTHHTILESDPKVSGTGEKPATGVRVRVRVEEAGAGDRTFIVRFDRSAQPVAIESVSADTSGDETLTTLGLPEIFPAALSAPPDRALRSGDRWTIDRAITLADSTTPTQLVGNGQLVELGIVEGERVARLAAIATLRLGTTRPAGQGLSPRGKVRLEGTQRTSYRATHDLDDGAVRTASSATTGSYRLLAYPPEGTGSGPATGTMEVSIRSNARRIR